MQSLVELWAFTIAWYNWPFTLALLVFLGLSALQFIGLGHDHEADVHLDVDHEVDFDHDLDHDFHLEHETDLDHDLDHDVDHEVNGVPAWAGMLEFLGVGHAPITMILLVWVGSFGILGWLINWFVTGMFTAYPGWVMAAVVVGAWLVSAWLTSRTAHLISRAIPAFSSTATSASQLVSRRGRVSSLQVDESYGLVKVRDSGGDLITVFAKVDPGKSAIPRDSEVYLVDYDATQKVYTVVPSD